MSQPVVLPLKSVCNPRDLGGYVGFGGRKVKPKRLLRTGKICNLSKPDQQFLLDYGLTKIIDLRSPEECRQDPDQKITGVAHFSLPISLGNNVADGSKDLAQTLEEYRHDQYAAFRVMCNRYRVHWEQKQAQVSFRKILAILAETESGAVLYHCSEGKDRTGLVTLLVLYLLGVDLEVIRQDYLYSNFMLNDYRARRDQHFKQKGENENLRANMRILGSVANAFFDTALITLQENFGGLESYLQNQLGVTPELTNSLRKLYLEK